LTGIGSESAMDEGCGTFFSKGQFWLQPDANSIAVRNCENKNFGVMIENEGSLSLTQIVNHIPQSTSGISSEDPT